MNAADFRDVFSVAAGVFGIGSQLTPQGEIGMLVEEPTDDFVDRCVREVLGEERTASRDLDRLVDLASRELGVERRAGPVAARSAQVRRPRVLVD